jgi:hypothetical protein
MKVLLWEFPTPLGFLPEPRLAKSFMMHYPDEETEIPPRNRIDKH